MTAEGAGVVGGGVDAGVTPGDPARRLRIRIDLGYDGTDFAGWAVQPELRTVQGVLETALARVLREPVRTVVAGRTDAGVHARHQVVHAEMSEKAWDKMPGRSDRPAGAALVQRVTGALRAGGARDVAVHRAAVAPPGFDARFSALWRRYSYRIADAPERVDALRVREVLAVRAPLDVAAMRRAAGLLLGQHDFLSFCKPRAGATTIRTLIEFSWDRDAEGLVVATVKADAFCHHMVRALVGACLKVGTGAEDEGFPARLLAAGSKELPMYVVAAHGLVLEEVAYPADAELAARADATRALRPTPAQAPAE